MELLAAPLNTMEFLAVDTETNGLGGDACEITEVGAVLVGGGELHDRWSSLVRPSAPLRRGIQRFTGISQAMVDQAPWPDDVLPSLAERLQNRVMVAHNAAFDRRVLRQAFERVGLDWPDPPVLCTAALARVMLPLQRERRLGVLADALGIEVRQAHRALADAETCARVLCALLPRLCAHASTVSEAIAALAPRRPSRRRARLPASHGQLPPPSTGVQPDFGELPKDPGVYLFRDRDGRVLYVGKSVSIRSRARAHFAPSAAPARWTAHAAVVDYQTTASELGALVLENRLIKELAPPGNQRLTARDDRLVYIRCRLDIPYPILEVGRHPAAGHAVTIGPMRGRRLAVELVEQLDSLFGLRHCGRRLVRRDHPSAYGQMGRCLSPCLGDLDPNLYRRRLDDVLRMFLGDDAAQPLLDHVERQMRHAASEQWFERAAALRRRRRRLGTVLGRLGGVLRATHAQPRLLLVPHPSRAQGEAFWIAGGRLVDSGPIADADLDQLQQRTDAAVARSGRLGELGAHVPPGEVDEVRILGSWLASHPETAQLVLHPAPDRDALAAFLADAASGPQRDDPVAGRPGSGHERELDDDRADLVGADCDV
ncbi:MAG: exonuclease domain-containing protein [Solirubrobacteraceae bacterium]